MRGGAVANPSAKVAKLSRAAEKARTAAEHAASAASAASTSAAISSFLSFSAAAIAMRAATSATTPPAVATTDSESREDEQRGELHFIDRLVAWLRRIYTTGHSPALPNKTEGATTTGATIAAAAELEKGATITEKSETGAKPTTKESLATATPHTLSGIVSRADIVLGDGLMWLYNVSTDAAVSRAAGRGNYRLSVHESHTMARVARLMRHVSLAFTLNGILEVAKAVQLALRGTGAHLLERSTVIHVLHAPDCFFSFFYASYILAASSAFKATAESSGRDIDYLMTALDQLAALWTCVRFPVLLQSLVLTGQILLEALLPFWVAKDLFAKQ
jgi:hypothetical protein